MLVEDLYQVNVGRNMSNEELLTTLKANGTIFRVLRDMGNGSFLVAVTHEMGAETPILPFLKGQKYVSSFSQFTAQINPPLTAIEMEGI